MLRRKNQKIKIVNVVGARPNFMKISPLYGEYLKREEEIEPILVHTNQHKDSRMSKCFFESLEIPRPDYSFNIKVSSPVEMISKVMSKMEKVLIAEKPNLVLVVGDVNTTVAAAIAANKTGISVAHVESGLRSFDRAMPEEINRIITDHISDFLFVTEKAGMENLKNSGVNHPRVFLVGNTMIDNLINNLPKIEKSLILQRLGLEGKKFILMTMHRPSNVDTKEGLLSILDFIESITISMVFNIVFPIHPRTKNNIDKYKLTNKFKKNKKLLMIDPMDYLDFIKLVKNSQLIMTDSGGIQEEAAYLKIPTLTLRNSTERPSTVDCGANCLIGIDRKKDILSAVNVLSEMDRNKIKDIKMNDGNSSKRIVDIIISHIKTDAR